MAPENTLASFQAAWELGVRVMELDVHLTRDGEVVCLHDDRLDRVTADWGPVSDWDWPALEQVPVMPGAFGGRYPDARIPRLADVLAALPAECGYLVELKRDLARPQQLVDTTLEVIRAAGAGSRCRLISFETDLLRRARSRLPELDNPAAPGLGVLVGAREGDVLLPRAREVQATALHPHHSLVDAELVATAQREGFLISTWTVNQGGPARRLAQLGVAEITTDDPAALSA